MKRSPASIETLDENVIFRILLAALAFLICKTQVTRKVRKFSFWPEREMCRKQDASAVSRMRKNIIDITNFEIPKTFP